MRVVITQGQLYNYAGSEVITLELAEYFVSSGYEVVVLTNIYDYPIKAEFDKMPEVKIILTSDKNIDRYLSENPPDLVWVHHQLIPTVLLRMLSEGAKMKFIFHHMSSLHPQEFPIAHELESSIASKVLFNAKKAEENVRAAGVMDLPASKVGVFGNPAPDRFYNKYRERPGRRLKKILVVSNHPPKELMDATDTLRGQGVQVEFYGMKQNSYSLISPVDIQSADVVVTIGKTYQYSLCSNVPVYCYDHFGGPGYITESNFETSRYRNFSGRNGEVKSADEIAHELIEGFDNAKLQTSILHAKYARDFMLSVKMNEILDDVSRVKLVNHPARADVETLQRINEIICMFHDAIHTKSKAVEAARVETEQRMGHEINRVRLDIQSSKAYRLGTAIAHPYRLIKGAKGRFYNKRRRSDG